MDKLDLKDLTFDELSDWVASLGEKPFRAKQIFQWVYRGARSVSEMTDLSKGLREKLDSLCEIGHLEIERKLVSKLDGTIKYLFRLRDGNLIESVLMSYKHGNTLCVSSQVGCRMGCRFCASTIGGLVRSLTPSEIIDQVMKAEEDSGHKISNIVMMGIGEPLDNYDNVIKFLKNLNHKDGLNIGYRHISLSTCGIADRIYDLAKENLPITLSVSLHSPFDEERRKLMPVDVRYPLPRLMEALKAYLNATGRRISVEYAMIRGVNDTKACAEELAKLFGGMLVHINLIPVNNVAERDFVKSGAKQIRQFQERLMKLGLSVTVRRELGSDINAACGQLRKAVLEEEKREQNKLAEVKQK